MSTVGSWLWPRSARHEAALRAGRRATIAIVVFIVAEFSNVGDFSHCQMNLVGMMKRERAVSQLERDAQALYT
jgi:hypothetical protein